MSLSTECAAALLSFRYASVIYFFKTLWRNLLTYWLTFWYCQWAICFRFFYHIICIVTWFQSAFRHFNPSTLLLILIPCCNQFIKLMPGVSVWTSRLLSFFVDNRLSYNLVDQRTKKNQTSSEPRLIYLCWSLFDNWMNWLCAIKS